jgi:DNA (cytosine-5)-methyltransferase 1
MNACSPDALAQAFGLPGEPADSVDVLAAGLPCQAFARIGRSKLRSLSGEDDAFKKDPRASLYLRFLTYVRAVQPLAILIENVPDILNFGGHNVPEEICHALERLGYRTAYTLLNAGFYGVPQLRERLILIGLANCLDADPTFPLPTHHIDLPLGYEGSRTFALKHVPATGSHFHPIPVAGPALPHAVSAKDAIADLPFISEHSRDPKAMRRRRVSDAVPYRSVDTLSNYGRAMRTWPGFETAEETDGHVVRVTPRDYPIFKGMAYGDDYPRAIRVAEELFRGKLEALARAGERLDKRSLAYAELRRLTIPPYDPNKFPNKWWKLTPSAPSRTLTAHLCRDTYSHIHYDGRQARTISVREAARLQSFPDGFHFVGSMNAAFRQIGNAVPPLLAHAVARTLHERLIDASRNRQVWVA